MEVERIKVAGIPIDIIRPEHLEQTLFELLAVSGTKQIVFLSVWNLLKARCNAEYRHCLENAALVLPTSKSIINGAVFLKNPKPVRYNPFTTLISFLTILETRYKSLYLLGGHKGALIESERNVHCTFPGLHVVGRYTGYFSKDMEKDILSAIFKANPSMVLLSDGIPTGIMWPYVRRNSFGSSIFVYYKDALPIFSKRKKRIPNEVFDAGHEIWHEILSNPLKVFLIFPFIWYIFLLIWSRLFPEN